MTQLLRKQAVSQIWGKVEAERSRRGLTTRTHNRVGKTQRGSFAGVRVWRPGPADALRGYGTALVTLRPLNLFDLESLIATPETSAHRRKRHKLAEWLAS